MCLAKAKYSEYLPKHWTPPYTPNEFISHQWFILVPLLVPEEWQLESARKRTRGIEHPVFSSLLVYQPIGFPLCLDSCFLSAFDNQCSELNNGWYQRGWNMFDSQHTIMISYMMSI